MKDIQTAPNKIDKCHLRPVEILLLLAIIALGFGLRLYGLDRQSLWADELFGISTAYMPHLKDIFPRLLADSHPPGYLVFLYFYVPFLDNSELQLRIHSLAAGTALVLVTFLFGRRYFSVYVGLIAALLVAVNYESIYYSQEARAYAMLSVTALLSLYYFTGFILDKTCSAIKLCLFILFSTLSAYLHYNGVVFVGCEGLIFFISLCARKWNLGFFRTGSLMFGLCGLLYLPWLKTMYHHMNQFSDYWGANQVIGPSHLLHLAGFLLGPYWEYSQYFLWGGWVASLLGGMQILLPKKIQIADSRTSIALLIVSVMAVMPIAVFYIKSQISIPVFQERHFVILTPLFMLASANLIAFFIQKITSIALRNIMLCLLLSVIAFKQIESNIAGGLYRIYFKDAIREAFDVIQTDKAFMASENPRVFTTHWQMGYYSQKAGFSLADSSIYSAHHYNELKKDLIKSGGFYFVSITPAENFEFIPASKEDFDMYCRRELTTRSGVISIVKMVQKGAPVSREECAPDLKFDFPVR